MHAQLPRGARLYLPDEAARKRHVESRLFDVFRRWGYREIVTPTFEYADVLARGTDLGVQENMFKLVDRETGRMLALRADITPQIARIVATRLRDEPKPLRLGYVTSVFRYDEPQVSHYREFFQAGVELIGLEKPEAEAEVIAMAVEGLRALGLDRFQLDLGHPDFFRGLLEEIKADTTRQQELREALARKDVSTLERVVGEIAPPAHVGDALCALPTLFGHAGVLEQAAGHARNERSARALANLSEVYRLLTIYGLADDVLLDLGEVRGFDYYSGTYFEAYVSGFGASVAGGGRYDHMLGRFGYECAAVGFAFAVARVLAVLEAHDDVHVRRDDVDDLALALVPPLRADYHDVRHDSSPSRLWPLGNAAPDTPARPARPAYAPRPRPGPAPEADRPWFSGCPRPGRGAPAGCARRPASRRARG